MSERKNLDQLFQEKFNNFEVAPPENAWQNIEIKLKEKEKNRRIAPFWWKFSSVAASITLLFFLFQNYDIQITKKGLNKVTTNQENTNQKEKVVPNLNTTKKQNAVVTNESQLNSAVQTKSNIANKKLTKKDATAFENNGSKANSIVTNDTKINNKKEVIGFNEKVNSENKMSESENKNNNKIVLKTVREIKSNTKNVIALNKSKKISIKNERAIAVSMNDSELKEDKINNKTTIIKNKVDVTELNSETQENKKNSKTIVLKNKIDSENKDNRIADNKISNSQSDTKFDQKIDKNNTILDLKTIEIKKNDSSKIAVVELNTLEKLLNEKEVKELKKKEPKLNRWQVTSNVAPIYFSSASNDSPLDAKFNNNQKDFISSTGAGLGVNYAVTKKLKIRTGINVLSMSYSTKDVVFYQTPINDKLNNLNPNAIGSRMQIENLSISSTPKVNGKSSSAIDIPSQVNINGGSLNQKIGYVEVPLEMAYKVLNKKLSVDIIGGLSTFYLRENTVSLKSSTVEMEIGEAKNLNKFHYSGNLGIGFKYGFLNHFEASVEPIYKYQINTFSNSELNFRPNSFGIYSGINYTF